MKFKIFFLISLLLFKVSSYSSTPSLILPAPGTAGMFVAFNYVLAGLYKYDKGEISALKVDFGNGGVYYDPTMGLNWWSYYFNPIELGKVDPNNLVHYTVEEMNNLAVFSLKTLSRKEANALIHKYIKIKPHIQKKISDFQRAQFKGYHVIGVHFRGTDKYQEIKRTPYYKVVEMIDQAVKEASAERKRYKIFVATDEQAFIDYLKPKYGAAIIHIDAIRSSDRTPIHFRDSDQYRVGEEAIIDCLLLSKCNVLIRTPSSLSAASEQFNPFVEVRRVGNWR